MFRVVIRVIADTAVVAIVLFVASPSLAKAVIPTKVPFNAFSSTELRAGFVSPIGEMSNSSTSIKLIVKDWVEAEPSKLVARTTML